MTASPARIGVVGYGNRGRRWAKTLKKNGVLAWVHDSDDKALSRAWKDLGEGYPIRRVDLDGVDGVVVASSWESRYHIARDALVSGVNVIAETPTLRSSSNVERVEALVGEHGVVWMSVLPMLYAQQVFGAVEALDDKRIGKIRHVRCQWYGGECSPHDDVLWQHGPHPASVLCSIAGKPPTRVRASSGARSSLSPSEFASLWLEYENLGWTAEVSLAREYPRATRTIAFHGERGAILCEPPFGGVEIFEHGEPAERSFSAKFDPTQTALDDFLRASYGEYQDPHAGIEITRQVVETLELCDTAIREGVAVP